LHHGDVFSGLGGFSEGLRQAGGFETVWACEKEKHAAEVFAANSHGGIRQCSDIWDVRPSQVPDMDIVTAGIPCQAFSTTGCQNLWRDPRSWVVKPLAGLIRLRRPRVVVCENVLGMTSDRQEGRCVDLLVDVLNDCGYRSSWTILNASEFGGCQHRCRLFLVADRDGREFCFDALRRSPPGRFADVLEPDEEVPPDDWLDPDDYELLTTPSRPTRQGLVLAGRLTSRGDGREMRGTDPRKSGHVHHASRVISPEGLAPCMLTRSGIGVIAIGARARWPTLTEIQRLQRLPESWLWPCTPTERRRLLGQSVDIGTIKSLGEGIREQLF
jgi:DNA (cytosine-5)-methyltransferase 1